MRNLLAISFLLLSVTMASAGPFRAGAASLDVTPEALPVIVNCGFLEQSGAMVRDPLHARALVLDDGKTRLAIVIVDSCMMPREFLDEAKLLIAKELQLPADRMLIAATHTHTAPAVMGCLGSDPDPKYGEFLQRQLVRVVRQAVQNLQPARAGWAAIDAGEYTNTRRWVLRSDKVRADPFGNLTVRANMHPGYQHPEFVGPSGPIDPWLSLLSIQKADGTPLAVLSNFSMHYFGSAPVSADYFGHYCSILEQRMKTQGFVALHSQGTSGDLHWMDYGQAQKKVTITDYAAAVVARAEQALAGIRYQEDVTLAMAERKLTLGRRTPDAKRLEWANTLLKTFPDRKPRNQPEIYAREASMLAAEPRRELILQALRVGEFGITAIPNEVYGLTGLKLKSASPLALTCNIELANGAEGYIPPAEQHVLGGYTTWPARSAGLEVAAERQISDTLLALLEEVAGKPRRAVPDPREVPYAKRVLAARPRHYWRLGELTGPTAQDLAGKAHGTYEPGVVFALNGPVSKQFEGHAAVNRAAHFAGGRVTAQLEALGPNRTIECWFWNGFQNDARPVSGTLVTVGGDSLVLHGKGEPEGVLGLPDQRGSTRVPFRTWQHAALVREEDKVRVYLNGKLELEGKAPRQGADTQVYLGGGPEGTVGLEGRLAEVAVYDRALSEQDMLERFKAIQE